ncbi:MAG: rRNA maturation RNase YbeY [Planctomycetota bacterium]
MSSDNRSSESPSGSIPEPEPEPPAASAGALDTSVTDRTGRLDVQDLAWLRRTLTDAAAAVARELDVGGEVRVDVIDDEAMAEAHQRWSGIAGTTDVLTFDLRDVDDGANQPIDTDAMICLDEAERQAATHNHDTRRELLLYAVHAILHCAGHDDRDEASAQAMHALEDRVLSAIGVGPVFATPASEAV